MAVVAGAPGVDAVAVGTVTGEAFEIGVGAVGAGVGARVPAMEKVALGEGAEYLAWSP